jgi:hypothetical protein
MDGDSETSEQGGMEKRSPEQWKTDKGNEGGVVKVGRLGRANERKEGRIGRSGRAGRPAARIR